MPTKLQCKGMCSAEGRKITALNCLQLVLQYRMEEDRGQVISSRKQPSLEIKWYNPENELMAPKESASLLEDPWRQELKLENSKWYERFYFKEI